MPKPDSLQGSLDLLVLKILSRRPRLHGYAIMSAVKDISSEVLRIEEGSLYPALHRMEEAGWIRAEWITKDTGRRARLYELTASGKKQLAAEESRWQAVTLAVPLLAGDLPARAGRYRDAESQGDGWRVRPQRHLLSRLSVRCR